MQADAEQTLTNLHVIAAISHNDKLMTNEDGFDIYAPTSLRGVFRMWYGERRAQNVHRIKQAVRNAMQFANKSLDDARALRSSREVDESMRIRVDTVTMHYMRMLDALERSRQGMENLEQTYRGDAALASQLQLLVSEINAFLQVMQPHTTYLRSHGPELYCPLVLDSP